MGGSSQARIVPPFWLQDVVRRSGQGSPLVVQKSTTTNSRADLFCCPKAFGFTLLTNNQHFHAVADPCKDDADCALLLKTNMPHPHSNPDYIWSARALSLCCWLRWKTNFCPSGRVHVMTSVSRPDMPASPLTPTPPLPAQLKLALPRFALTYSTNSSMTTGHALLSKSMLERSSFAWLLNSSSNFHVSLVMLFWNSFSM